MKIIIVGAGNVGSSSAGALCKLNDVLMIEKDAAKADDIKSTLNVSVLHEDGSNPRVLKSAIERTNADVLIAAVPEDGINLFMCMMSKRIKPSIKTVACLRDPDFEVKTSADGVEGIDLIISPEQIMADKMSRIAALENVIQYDYIQTKGAALVKFKIPEGSNIVGKVIMDLGLIDKCSVVAIYRNDEVILNNETAQIHVGDRISILGAPEVMDDINKMIGIEKEAKEFIIIGATIAGIAVAKNLARGGKRRFIKIIDKNEAACRNAARVLSDVVVVNADVADPLTLKSENVSRADVIISVSTVDERNLLTCMAALKFGTRKIITKYSTKEYEEIFNYTGLESMVGYHRVISNEVTKHLVYDENAIMKLEHEDEFFFGVTVDEKSAMIDRCYGDIKVPEGVRIVALMRDTALIYPKMNTMFLKGDKALIFTHGANPLKLSKFVGHQTPVGL